MYSKPNSPPSDVDCDNCQVANCPELISPYTRGIAECLQTLGDQAQAETRCDQTLRHLLCNLLQGRLLEYLRQQLLKHYKLDNDEIGERFSLLLVDVFKEEIFGTFRSRIEADPEIVPRLARHIVDVEIHTPHYDPLAIEELYQNILQEHLGYPNVDAILQTLQTDGRIQNLVVASMLQKARIRPLSPSVLSGHKATAPAAR
jgi:hypothetical protein